MALSADNFLEDIVPLLSEKFQRPPYINMAYGMSIEGTKFPHTGLFVYARLVHMQEDNKEYNMFPSQIRREYSDFIDDLNFFEIFEGDTVPSSSSFSKYFYYMREIGVLEDRESTEIINKYGEDFINSIVYTDSEGDTKRKFDVNGSEIKGRRVGKDISYHTPNPQYKTKLFERSELTNNDFKRRVLDVDERRLSEIPKTFGIEWMDVNLDDLNIVEDINKVNFALAGKGKGVSTEYGRRYDVILPTQVRDFQKVYRNQT